MIILDMGSGNGDGNSKDYIRECIKAIKEADSGEKDVVLKWQLFRDEPPNVPLTHESFEFAYNEAGEAGYKVTASVFDHESLMFLKTFDVPFIKIPCRPALYPMVRNLSIPVVVSYPRVPPKAVNYMCCVPKYPAQIDDYLMRFSIAQLEQGISDHTFGFDLYEMYQPKIYEKHFVLERNEDNPDAGEFAVIPEELGYIL